MASESIVSQVQRKIELQSPDDLTYLITNVRNAAAARLNEAFPHLEGDDGEDDLRNQIEALVNEVRQAAQSNHANNFAVFSPFACANSEKTNVASPYPASST
jgi:kinetochor protein Mis14/NSL1